MKVKFKKTHHLSKTPKYAKNGDAGMDLTAVSVKSDDKNNAIYNTGICVEIPEGYVGLLFPRSSIANKNQVITNSVGIIDSGYRGEITVKMKSLQQSSHFCKPYEVGEKICQLIIIPYPQIEFEEVEELSESERGTSNYGSTGK